MRSRTRMASTLSASTEARKQWSKPWCNLGWISSSNNNQNSLKYTRSQSLYPCTFPKQASTEGVPQSKGGKTRKEVGKKERRQVQGMWRAMEETSPGTGCTEGARGGGAAGWYLTGTAQWKRILRRSFWLSLVLLKALGRINESLGHGKIKQWLIPYWENGGKWSWAGMVRKESEVSYLPKQEVSSLFLFF